MMTEIEDTHTLSGGVIPVMFIPRGAWCRIIIEFKTPLNRS